MGKKPSQSQLIWLSEMNHNTSSDISNTAFSCVCKSPGRVLAQASANGVIHLLDLKSGQIHKLVGHESEVHTVVFSHDGENLYSGGSDGTVRLWF
ncbi:Sperm-associated antigen 16 protein [Microtus ochrogaster]|uniref:Sperm-associated antigen 16 protein n=1 Tax=Microtus ochrogaster TaxID=79684 RepID=A0A8J6GW21_MICOH|nr:Sperm-associated antigen 16 protein [Microtus ochrogaster]